MTVKTFHSRLMWATVILLVIAASRFMLLPNLSFDQDEVWSIWQSDGTVSEITARNPFDFPPGYYLSLGLWQSLTGNQPFALRMSLVLMFMVNSALMFAVGRRMFNSEQVGLLTAIIYAGLGYIVYLSILLRPYPMIMMLFPAGFYFTMRYFEQPSMKHALQLGIILAIMWYVALTSAFAFLVYGLYTLFLHTRKLWRWVFPGIIALILALPEILSKVAIVTERGSKVFESNLPPYHIALLDVYKQYLGSSFLIWMILICLALIGFVLSRKQQQGKLATMFLIWMLAGPLLLYVLHSRTNLFAVPRYGWWIAPAIALWIAYGLNALWKRGFVFIALGLSLLLFVPQAINDYKEPLAKANFEGNFAWLAEHYESGDIVIIDPNINMYCDCKRLEVWNYYETIFFPKGIQFASEPSPEYRRIWYIRTVDKQDQTLFDTIQQGRVASIFNGDPGFFTQLYLAPPDVEGILFANGLRFHGHEVLQNARSDTFPIVRREGDQIRLRLWWSVDKPLEQEYSIGIQVIDPSGYWGLYAQNDDTAQPIYLQPNLADMLPPIGTMSTWQPDQFYVEERVIELPYLLKLHRTQFTVFMTVYQWWDGVRVPATETNADDLLPLFDFTLVAW